MEPTFTNPVVTSKAADDHYDDIMAQHSGILNDIEQQAKTVEDFNRNQSIAQAQTDAQKMQQKKDQTMIDQKNQELEIKRMALSS